MSSSRSSFVGICQHTLVVPDTSAVSSKKHRMVGPVCSTGLTFSVSSPLWKRTDCAFLQEVMNIVKMKPFPFESPDC